MKSEEKIKFEDFQEGDEVPSLRVKMDKEEYLLYSKMVKEINPLHFDEEYAKSLGFRTIVVAGVYTYSFITKMFTDWLKDPECVQSLETRYISPIYIEDAIVNKGVVKRKYLQNGEKIAECEVWVENQEGEKVTEGKVRIIIRELPILRLEREYEALLKMKEKLMKDEKYRGKWVAIFGGKLIDFDEDDSALAKRVYEKYGYETILIDRVVEKEKPLRFPSPKFR